MPCFGKKRTIRKGCAMRQIRPHRTSRAHKKYVNRKFTTDLAKIVS